MDSQPGNESQPEGKVILSIVIPTFNRPERLRSCLQSLSELNVGENAVQVIVVNDGSTAAYDSVVKAFGKKLDLVYVNQEKLGPAAARNAGAERARGRYLVFLDDDCTLPPDWMRAAISRLRQDCATGGRTVNCLTKNLFSESSQMLIDYLYEYYNRDSQNARFVTSNNLIIPRETFIGMHGFDVEFTDVGAEDRDLCDRLRQAGFQIVYSPEIVVRHFHAMNLGEFLRQHFKYGYRAGLFHEKRKARSKEKLRLEPPRFYMDLILFPFRRKRGKQALLICLLMILSQVANFAGFSGSRLQKLLDSRRVERINVD